jgi:hypothetical protein
MPALIQYQLSSDANRFVNGDVIYPAKYINAYVLVGGAAQAVTIPAGARVAIFSSNNNFYANFQGGSAAVPAVNVTNGTAPELNPVARDLTGLTTFSIISADSCVVTIAYFL